MNPWLLIFGLVLSPQGRSAEPPSFECKDPSGAKYRLWFTPERNSLVLENSLGKREYLLSEPNLKTVLPAESPLYYVGLSEKGRTAYSRYQMGTMVRTDFYQAGGKGGVSVDILLDHRPVPGLTCQTPQFQSVVTSGGERTPTVKRAAEPLLKWGGRIDNEGKLDPISLLAVEASVLQLYNSEKAQDPAALEAFAQLVFSPIRKMPPAAVETLKRRLTAKEREFLDSLLELCRYRQYPDLQRYADWIAEGLEERNPDLVQGGFYAFFASNSLATKALRTFFEGELKKTLPKLDPYSIVGITQGLKPDQEAFVLTAWGSPKQAEYRALKAAHPFLKEMERNLTRPRRPEEGAARSQFGDFVTALSQLIRLPEFAEPALQDHVRAKILPLIDRLSPKERSNLNEILPETEKSAIEFLRKKKSG